MAILRGNVTLQSDRGPGARQEMIPEYKKMLIRRQANRAVFVTMLMGNVFGKDRPASIPKIRHQAADNGYQFKWFERSRLDPVVTVSTQATAAATSLTCSDCSAVTACEVLRVIKNPGGTTGELVFVDEDTAAAGSATTLTVKRAQYGTTGNIIYANAELLRLHTAVPETGITGVGARAATLTEVFGATQEYWVEMKMTKRRRSSPAWYGNDWMEDQKDRIADHLEGIERSFLFNEAAQVTATDADSTELVITTAGVEGRISTHRFNASGNCGYDDLVDYLGTMQIENAGNNCQWICLCGQRVLRHLTLWGIDYLQTRPMDDAFGITYQAVKIPNFGNLVFYWAPVMDKSHMSDGVYIIDTSPDSLALRYLQELPSHGEGSGRAWDIATTIDGGEWLDITAVGDTDKAVRLESNVGLEMPDEKRHGLIQRFTTT